MKKQRLLVLFLIALLTVATNPSRAQESSEETRGEYTPTIKEGSIEYLSYFSPKAKSLAKQLGLTPLIKRLYLVSKDYRNNPTRDKMIDVMFLRQQISDNLQYTSFQVQDVLAAIDLDLAHTDRIYDYLANKKDRAEFMTSVATFLTTGTLSIIGNSLTFGNETFAPRIFGVIGGSASVLLPSYRIFPKRFERPGITKKRPTMLAQLFNKETDDRTEYNSIVWNYLNSKPPNATKDITRKQYLFSKWNKERGMDRIGSKFFKRKIDVVTGDIDAKEKVNLELLDLRANLLGDLRAEVSRLYRDLAELKAAVMAL